MAGEYPISLPVHKKHSDESIADFVSRFRSGDYSRREEFIIDHARLAIVIGLRIDGEDGIGVAFETLCMVPDEVRLGRLVDNGLVGYTIARIKTRCVNAKRKNIVFGIPTMTASRHGLTMHRVVSPQRDPKMSAEDHVSTYGKGEDTNKSLLESFPDSGEEARERVKALYNEILSCTVIVFEYEVIKLRAQWYNDYEIAAMIGCGKTKVREARLVVEARWMKLREALDEKTRLH